MKEVSSDEEHSPNLINYQYAHGETDLFENNLRWKGSTYILATSLGALAFICISTLILLAVRAFPSTSTNNPTFSPTNIPTSAQEQFTIQTNTPQPTIVLATITQGPPTLTPSPSPTTTPTEGPCTQQVNAGDDLISIIFRCGHRDLEPILSTVVSLNNLRDPASIQQGQVLEIPWPTPTIDPNLTPSSAPNGEQIEPPDSEDSNGESIMGVQLVPTETLQPGVAWHTIQKDENIIAIAVQYGATLRILSDLNPEVTFSQCDFGFDSGGPSCIVQIYEGQRIRVPAPTPTPTIQPTASGSETPTPSATPTFNAPNILSPSDRAFFGKNDLITLRWSATGALGIDEAYFIQVNDQTTGKAYTATTQELFFIIPDEWHGQDSTRHDYQWSISVINTNNPDNPLFTTQLRTFTWEGQGT